MIVRDERMWKLIQGEERGEKNYENVSNERVREERGVKMRRKMKGMEEKIKMIEDERELILKDRKGKDEWIKVSEKEKKGRKSEK